MKILIAVHHFPPVFGGGAEWRAYRTADYLQKAGHQVQIVCVDSITYGDGQTLKCDERSYNGLKVHGLHFNLAKSPDPFSWSYCNPVIGEYVSELLKKFSPDILHIISGYLMSGTTLEAAVKIGLPTVLTLTDFWFLCPRITLMRSDGSLCVSPAEPLNCTICLRKERRRYRLPDQLTGGLIGKLFSFFCNKNCDKLLIKLQKRKTYLLSLLNRAHAVICPSMFLQNMFVSMGIDTQKLRYM